MRRPFRLAAALALLTGVATLTPAQDTPLDPGKQLTDQKKVKGKLRLDEVDAKPSEDGTGIELVAMLSGEGVEDSVLERAVALLAIEPGLSHADWRVVEAG